MSDPGPLPEPRGRRTWLWIVLGLLGACILICVVGGVWVNSGAGRDFFCGLATEAATSSTQPLDPEAAQGFEQFCTE